MTNDELRALAEAALRTEKDSWIAWRKAATPERVIALVDENERLQRVVDYFEMYHPRELDAALASVNGGEA